MTNDLTADEVRVVLKLEPHGTRGFVRRVYQQPTNCARRTLSTIS
jgi:hypothetical protein